MKADDSRWEVVRERALALVGTEAGARCGQFIAAILDGSLRDRLRVEGVEGAVSQIERWNAADPAGPEMRMRPALGPWRGECFDWWREQL